MLAAVRAEAVERQALARQILPAAQGSPEAIHIWLDTPDHWPGERLRDTAQSRGLSLVTADAFATTPGARAGLRISLGGPAKQSVLAQALRGVAAILSGEPAGRMVV